MSIVIGIICHQWCCHLIGIGNDLLNKVLRVTGLIPILRDGDVEILQRFSINSDPMSHQ